MSNLLAIDIGNTNINAGIFIYGKMVVKSNTPTHVSSLYRSFISRLIKKSALKVQDIDKVIVSSVVPLTLSRLIVELKKCGFGKVDITGRDMKIPVANKYRNKKEVGQDRLVNAYAAGSIYGKPCVVIDFGTAITFDIISGSGDYLGGLIMPGIEISLASLYNKTALLPRVELESVSSIIGKDTVSSIRGGILFGFGAMCDGLVAQYRKLLSAKARVIATGGNARLMKRYAKSIQIVDDDLTLKGLALLAK